MAKKLYDFDQLMESSGFQHKRNAVNATRKNVATRINNVKQTRAKANKVIGKKITTKSGRVLFLSNDGNYYEAAKNNTGSGLGRTRNYRGEVLDRTETPTRANDFVRSIIGTGDYNKIPANKVNLISTSNTRKSTSTYNGTKRKDLKTSTSTRQTSPTKTTASPRKTTATKPTASSPSPTKQASVASTSTRQNRTATRATATPRGSSRQSSSSTPDGNYTIKRGDSLWRIAHNNGMTLNELMRQNPQIKNINQVIHPGDKLNVSGKNTQTAPTPSTPKYEDIILDDTKMQPSLNVTPSTEQITPPDRIAPISYNYKKKKR